MQRFADRIAIVSGGLGTIGRAIGARLAAEGAQVVLADLPKTHPDLDAAPGLPAIFVPLDVTDAGSWADAIKVVLDRFGRLDVLVNNAGVLTPEAQPFDEIVFAEWRRVFSVNVDGVLLGTQAAMGQMKRRGGGAIVNIASIAGYIGSADNGTAPMGRARARCAA